MGLTTEQNDAINSSGNVLVAAAAGSGKTTILTHRIMKTLEEDYKANKKININNYLVLTFTNAAAYSMKNKIKNLINDKLNDDKVTDEEKKFWNKQYILVDSADISTFHGFGFKLIKQNAFLLGLRSDIERIDDLDLNVLIYQVIDNELNKAFKSNNLTNDLLNAILINNGMKTFNEFQNTIKKMYDYIKKIRDVDEAKNKLIKNYDVDNNPDVALGDIMTKEKYKKIVEDNKALIKQEKENESEKDALKTIVDGYLGKFDDMSSEGKFPTITAKVKENNPNVNFDIFKNCKDAVDKAYKKLSSGTTDDGIDPEQKAIDDFKKNYDITAVLEIFNIAKVVYEEVKRIKRERNVLEFDDMEEYLSELLNVEKDSKKDTIIASLKDKYKYIYVDEYQDTSKIQDDIVNALENNNLFAVGDIKQSIYSFRGAKPDLFNARFDNYKEGKGGALKPLNTNFRSSEEIINVVNTCFKKIMSKDLCHYDYEALTCGNEKSGHKVEYIFINGGDIGQIIFNPKLVDETNETTETTETDEKTETDETTETTIIEEVDVTEEKENETEEINKEEASNESQKESINTNRKTLKQIAEEQVKQEDDVEDDGDNQDTTAMDVEEVSESELKSFMKYSYLLAAEIRRLHDEEGIKYSDIAILGRPMNAHKKVLCTILNELNVPYRINREGFLKSDEVKLLESFLRTLDFEYDSLELTKILTLPHFNFTMKDIFNLTRSSGESFIKKMYSYLIDRLEESDNDNKVDALFARIFNDNIDESTIAFKKISNEEKELIDKIIKFLKFYYDCQKDCASKTPSELVKKFIKETNYELFVGLDENYKIRNIYDFINLLEKLEKSSSCTIRDALQIVSGIENNTLKMDEESNNYESKGEDCVQIETIHKSKGLQYKVVFLILLEKKINFIGLQGKMILDPNEGLLLSEMDYEELSYKKDGSKSKKTETINNLKAEMVNEETRILYVGMTRAKERLYIYAYDNVQKKEESVYRDGFYKEIVDSKKFGTISKPVKILENVFPYYHENQILDFKKMYPDLEDSINFTYYNQIELEKRAYELRSKYIDDSKAISKDEIAGFLNKDDKEERSYAKVPYSLSVSQIKHDKNQNQFFIYNKKIKDMFDDDITSTEKGTLYHMIAKFIDKDTNLKDLFDKLYKDGIITEKQKDFLNEENELKKLENYKNSKLVQNVLANADKVYREYPFIMKMKAGDIYKEGLTDEEKDYDVIVEGIVDLFVVKDNKITIFDYKTDKIRGEVEGDRRKNIEHIKNMYQIQLDLYADAVSKAYGMKVDKTYLYLFNDLDNYHNDIIE